MAAALQDAQRGLADDPLREDFVRDQIALQYALGDRAGALQAYRQFAQALKAELGAPPMAETQELARLGAGPGVAGRQQALPGKKPQASLLSTYPSYLGRLLETGLRLGYTPADFGLERILLGGEIVTEGLKRRSQAIFGPVQFSESYGMTEP